MNKEEFYIVNSHRMRQVGRCIYDSYLQILKNDNIPYVVKRKDKVRVLVVLEE